MAAVALGACILEKHFTSDKTWPGPDIPISIDPGELRDLIAGTRAIHAALGGRKDILAEEQPTIDFAYACVVAIRDIAAGERFTVDNVWVKRPGTGEIRAERLDDVVRAHGRAGDRGRHAGAPGGRGRGWSRGMSEQRVVAVFTGNRAEYGLQYPILRAVAADPRLDYRLIAGGAHLDEDFGATMDEIDGDGFDGARRGRRERWTPTLLPPRPRPSAPGS